MWPGRRALWLYAGLALLLVQLHAAWVNYGPKAERRAQRHEAIVHFHGGEAPWAYRLAVPLLAEALARPLRALGLGRADAREGAYLAWRWLFTFGLFVLFHRYLSAWLEPPWPLAGTLLLAALHGPSYAHYWFQPASALDLLAWVAAAELARARRDAWLFLLVPLAALNRETAVFLPLLHLAFRWGTEPPRRSLLRAGALLLLWVAVFAGLRLLVPVRGWAHGSTVLGLLLANLRHPDWLLYAASLYGALWLLPLLRWRELPPEQRRLALVLLPYLLLQLAFGRLRELRLLLPLSLLLLPVGLAWLREESAGEAA